MDNCNNPSIFDPEREVSVVLKFHLADSPGGHLLKLIAGCSGPVIPKSQD